LSMDVLTDDELLMLRELAKDWGLLDTDTFKAMETVNGYARAVKNGSMTLEEMAEKIKKMNDRMLETPRQIDIVYNIVVRGQIPNTGGGHQGEETPYYQHGGTTWGRGILVGEHGPELLTGVPGGARVLSNPTTARLLAQNSVTNNYSLTTNSLTRPGGLALEFAAMEMGSR